MEGETITISNTSSGSEKSFDTLSILVVDDDTTCLSIVAAILKKFKYEVVTVKHPNDALCALRIKGGAFDLVVSDVHMPDMNGFELQNVIAQEFNLPVVLMSADNEEGVALKGLRNGAAFFILKPVSADDLRDLWQFASMYCNKKNQVLSDEKTYVDEINNISESSTLEEDGNIKKDPRNSPRKEGPADGKRGEVSESSQKKPKVVWTNALHNRFLDAIRSIGFHRAVPKKILEVMNVPGLTRENIASHLQKYRIFLRRVSGADYKIHYAADKCFNRSFRSILTSSRINPSILMLNNFINNQHQNPGRFPGANNGIFFQNQAASSSSSATPAIENSRILSQSGGFLRPNLTNSSLLIQDAGLSRVSFAQSNNLSAASGMEDLSGSLPTCFQASLVSSAGFNIPRFSYEDSPRQEISVLTNDTVSTNYKPSNCVAYQTNYVGLRMSNLKQLTDSGLSKTNQGTKPCSGMATLPGFEFQGNILDAADQDFPNDDMALDRLLESIGDSSCFAPDANGGKQLSDVIADYQMLISPSNLGSLIGEVENGGGTQESVFGPDLVAFDYHTMSSERSMLQQNGGNNTINYAPSQFSATLLSPSEREDQEFLASLLASDQFGVEQTTLDGLNPRQAVKVTKLEYGRGKGNFRWSGEMPRDWKEHQWRKHSAGPTLTLRDES